MTKLANNWAALLDLWDKRQHQYEQCLDLHLFYRDSEQVDSWMSRQEVTGRIQQVSRTSFSPLIYHHMSIYSLTTISLVLSLSWELKSEPQRKD